MEKIRPEGRMVIKKVCQSLRGGTRSEQNRNEQPERAGSADLESFSTALVELRPDESVPFQSSNPWTGV